MSEFKNMADRFVRAVYDRVPQINERLAMNAFALMRNRIQNEGTIGENKSLGDYSNNEIPLFFKKGGKTIAPFSNPLNKGGEQFFLKKVKQNSKLPRNEHQGISYKEWRKANNLPADHVNLTFTGETLRDIGVIKTIVSKDQIVVSVGAKNTKLRRGGVTTDQVLEGWRDRYGDGILQPNSTELHQLQIAFEKDIQKLIDESFK